MAIVRSFLNGGQFDVTDYTEELLIVPNEWGTIGRLGIFSEESVSQNVVTFEEVNQNGNILVDRVRGERATVGADYVRKIRTVPVPHFPHDEYITPQDIQGKRAYGSPNDAETLAGVRARKLERIRRNHAWTLEFARAKAITTGDVYAPNGTVSVNWYTEFGLTQKTVDFALQTSTTEPLLKQEEVIAYIVDNVGNGQQISGVIGLASPEFFNKLVTHANVKLAYQFYRDGNQQPLRNRLTAAGNSSAAVQRMFEYGGITYIEMRDTYNNNGTATRLIPAGDCYFVAEGTDAFVTYFGPANKFEFANTLGEQAYAFEYASPKGDKIEIETESNFCNVIRRPQAIVRGYTA